MGPAYLTTKEKLGPLVLRSVGVLAFAFSCLYTYKLSVTINSAYSLWAWIFIVSTTIGTAMLGIFVVNNFSRSHSVAFIREPKQWPTVAVLIPVWNEPIDIVRITIDSVIQQSYPSSRLALIITDDGYSSVLRKMARDYAKQYPHIRFAYNNPPKKDSDLREQLGEGKAGNLNSALSLVLQHDDIAYVETRDCDDMVGNSDFLKYCVSYLVEYPEAAFVQTIKDVQTDAKDTFDNHQNAFYRHELRAKDAANAVFPCGSGVVYRKSALQQINGFAAWNLVEDFQTGMELLRKGWRGGYLPIVGAMGQIAPHDMPNFYKQRGTWTLDAIRLLLFRRKSGLNLRQRLHFSESALFYMLSWIMIPFSLSTAASLITNKYPFSFTTQDFLLYFWPALFLTQAYVYIARGAPNVRTFIRTYQVFWISMVFVYFKMFLKALWYGPNRKPRYVNTRKTHKFGIYWRSVIPHLAMVLILIVAASHEVVFAPSWQTINFFAVGWALFFAYMFMHSLRMAVFGVKTHPK